MYRDKRPRLVCQSKSMFSATPSRSDVIWMILMRFFHVGIQFWIMKQIISELFRSFSVALARAQTLLSVENDKNTCWNLIGSIVERIRIDKDYDVEVDFVKFLKQ